ncbi:flagellar assembly protein FliH [Alteromonadaceae bacterium BrNp21-10]|nr:flagellar assembly protein FliH [Alteromonadaceae bacterium BrNp21-10]
MSDFNVDEDDGELKAWELPFVEDSNAKDDTKTNAINKRSNWVYEPPDADLDEDLALPTAEEIEAIREAAFQEGFEEGKQQGVQQGITEGTEQGKQEGHEKGLEQGLEQGLAAAEEQINELLSALKAMIDTLANPLQQVDAEVEQELVVLATSLAKSVIRTEVKTNQDVIFQALSEGLKVLPIKEQYYQIRLHPEDLQLLKQHFSDDEVERHNWQLLEAPEMTRGGCDIVTNSNAVDLSIERRTRDILDKFLLDQGLSS